MTDKQIIIDGVSNFCLVCYYDNKTNELTRIEPYYDNDTSMYSDIDSYRYGYNAEITKPEEIIKQLKAKEQECEELKKQLIKCDDNIIVDCEYSKKDLCSFIHRKKEVINGLQQQLDQLKAQLLDQEAETLKAGGIIHILEQTLTEIKEIAENGKRFAERYMITGEQKANVLTYANAILQKISECEINNEC